MIGGLVVFSMLAALAVVEVFVPKSSKTPEEKLGEALTEYLKSGVKVKQEDKKQ